MHAHIGSQVFDVAHFEQAAEVLGGFFAPLDLPELVVGGGLGVAYVNGETGAGAGRVGGGGPGGLRGRRRVPGYPDTAEPGRSIVATAGITLYRVGTVKELPGIRTYVAVDGGMSDNPRPVLYGSGYEAFLPREVEAPRPRDGPGRRQALRERRRRGVRGPRAGRPGGGRRAGHPGDRGLRLPMASNYNKVPRPPVVFVADGRPGWWCGERTLDDLLRLDA